MFCHTTQHQAKFKIMEPPLGKVQQSKQQTGTQGAVFLTCICRSTKRQRFHCVRGGSRETIAPGASPGESQALCCRFTRTNSKVDGVSSLPTARNTSDIFPAIRSDSLPRSNPAPRSCVWQRRTRANAAEGALSFREVSDPAGSAERSRRALQCSTASGCPLTFFPSVLGEPALGDWGGCLAAALVMLKQAHISKRVRGHGRLVSQATR